ncbi:type I-E CRISPR-associated protein Cas6/Cse3/CasE [bacterium]|nr:type I-E CRISPR-associated protein Cas6/Cse3/CasE [bacterium]
MFLSLLHLDMRDAARGRLLLRDAYALHRRLWRAFGSSKGRPFLFRVEPDRPARILVQSTTEPDWQQAFANAPGYLERPAQVRPLQLNLEQGQRWRFRIRANPTRKVPRYDPKTGDLIDAAWKRRAIADSSEQWAWLKKRLADAAEVEPRPVDFFDDHGQPTQSTLPLEKLILTGTKRPDSQSKAQDIHVISRLFEGTLTVADGGKLSGLIEKGIGPAKAFGCGLLSVAPA